MYNDTEENIITKIQNLEEIRLEATIMIRSFLKINIQKQIKKCTCM